MVIDTDTEIQTAHTIEDEGEYDVTVSVSVCSTRPTLFPHPSE